jgi:DNA-binding response OmpR family regulator
MIPAKALTDSRTVLLVDDDSSMLDLYSRRLGQAGFQTESAFDPAGVHEALPNLSVDLIILNLMLAGRGGFDLLQIIRADDRGLG